MTGSRWASPRRRSWSATPKPRADSPTACTTRGARNATGSRPVFRDKIPHRREFQLSWLTLEQLEAEWDHLDPIGSKRARHVLSENERVRQGVEALKHNDVSAFGRLMSASHASSRDDFENSSPALDALIEAAESAPGFLGGKLSGAGWAGCTVNLVRAEHAHDFAESVRATYSRHDRHGPRDPHLPGRRRRIRPRPRAVRRLNRYDQDMNHAPSIHPEENLTMLWARMLADLIVVFHAAYVSFVVFGLVAILLGVAFRWNWVRNIWFRAIHLIVIGIVVGRVSLAGVPCPLTVWEAQLRRIAGQTAYTGDFLGHWAHRLIFFRVDPLGFHLDLYRFGLAVLAAFVLAPPRRSAAGSIGPIVAVESRENCRSE